MWTIFAKAYITDVWQGSKYASIYNSLTHILPMLQFCTPWKRQKTEVSMFTFYEICISLY